MQATRQLAMSGGVGKVVISPDSKYLVRRRYHDAVVWSLDTGQEVSRLKGHASTVLHMVVTPDSRHVVTSSMDRTIRVWELLSGAQVHQFDVRFPKDLVRCAPVITPDGGHIVCGVGTTVRMWSLASDHQECNIVSHSRVITTVAVTPDGRHIVSGSSDGTILVSSLEAGETRFRLGPCDDGVQTLAITPDSRLIVSLIYGGIVRLWWVDSGKKLVCPFVPAICASQVMTLTNDMIVLSDYRNPLLRVYSLATGEELVQFAADCHAFHSFVVTTDLRYIMGFPFEKNHISLWPLQWSLLKRCDDALLQEQEALTTLIDDLDTDSLVQLVVSQVILQDTLLRRRFLAVEMECVQ